MGIWTPPLTWDTGRLVTAADLNTQIRDNLLYLKSPPIKRLYNISLVTSSTAYVPIVETQSIITQPGGRVLVLASGFVTASAVPSWFDVNLMVNGGPSYAFPNMATRGDINRDSTGQNGRGTPWAFAYLTGETEAAFHTFRLYGRAGGIGAASGLTFVTASLLLLEV